MALELNTSPRAVTLRDSVTDLYSPQNLGTQQAMEIANASQFGRGWESAGLGEQASELLSKANAAALAGDNMLAQTLEQQGRDLQTQAQQWAPRVQNFTDIASAGGAMDWGMGALGNIRSSVRPALGGIAGAGLGLGAALLSRGRINPATAANWGSRLGGFGAGYDMMADDSIGQAMTDDKIRATRSMQDIRDAGRVSGVVQGALESIVPVGVANSLVGLGKKAAGKGLLKRVATDAAEEFATEFAQNPVGDVTQNYLRGEPLGNVDWKAALNAGLSGAVGGGGMGVVGGVADVAHDRLAQGVEKVDEVRKNPLETLTDAIAVGGTKAGQVGGWAWEGLKTSGNNYLDKREAKLHGMEPEAYAARKNGDAATQAKLDAAGVPKLRTDADIEATLAQGRAPSFDTLSADEQGLDDVTLDATVKSRADKHANDILSSPREYSESERQAAAAYQGHGDYVQFRNELKSAATKNKFSNLAAELDERAPKMSKLNATGETAQALADLWLQTEGIGVPLFKDGQQDPDARMAATKLMAWVASGYGAEHNDGQTFIPYSLIDELGADAQKLVQSMTTLAVRQGLLKDTKQVARVLGEVKQRAQDQSGDTAFVEKMMLPLSAKVFDKAGFERYAGMLRSTGGKASAAMRKGLAERFGADKVDEVLRHFEAKEGRYRDPSLGMTKMRDGTADDMRDAKDASEDTGFDAITEADDDWNSGVGTFSAPKETIMVLSEHDMADPDQVTTLMDNKKREGVEEMGVVDHLRALKSGAELQHGESALLSKYDIPLTTDRKASLVNLNRQHRVLVERKFDEATNVIQPEHLAKLKSRISWFNPKTRQHTPIDSKHEGKVFIELGGGEQFVTSAAKLVRTVRASKDVESDKSGVREVEERFLEGLGQLLDALAKDGQIVTGRIGYKNEAGGEITWLKKGGNTAQGKVVQSGLFKRYPQLVGLNLPKDFNYLGMSTEGYTKGAADKQRGHVGKGKKETDLTMGDVQNMTVPELKTMVEDKVEKGLGVKQALEIASKDLVKDISNKQKAHDRAVKNGNSELAKKLKGDLVELHNALANRTDGLKDAMQTLRGQIETLREIIDQRIEGTRPPGEQREASRSTERLTGQAITTVKSRDYDPKGHFFGSKSAAEANARPSDTVKRVGSKKSNRWVIERNTGVIATSERTNALSEGEEMSASSSKKVDTKPIERDLETGLEVVTEPTDSDGFYDERKAAAVRKEYFDDMKRAETAEKHGEHEKAAALRTKYDKTPFDAKSVGKNLWAVNALRKGVPSLAAKLQSFTTEQLSGLATVLRSQFWTDSVVMTNDATKLSTLKARAEKILAMIEERGGENAARNDTTTTRRAEQARETSGEKVGDKPSSVTGNQSHTQSGTAEIRKSGQSGGIGKQESVAGAAGDDTPVTSLVEQATQPVKGSLADPHVLPMTYKILDIADIRPELRSKYRKGDGIAKLIASGDRTATTRTPPSGVKVGDHITFPGVEGVYQVTGFDKIDLRTAEGREAWSKKEGWDASMFDAFGKQVQTGATQMTFKRVDTKQSAQQATQVATPEAVQAAKDHILKTLGDSVETKFIKRFNDGSSGSWSKGNTLNLIRLALNGDVLGTSFHESFHELVSILKQHGGAKTVELLQRVATNPLLLRKVELMLEGHPQAVQQLKNPEEAAAFMYQFWQAGALKVGPETASLFEKIKNLLKDVVGLFSESVRKANGERRKANLELHAAEDILRAFSAGAVAKTDTRAAVVAALNSKVEAHDAAVKRIGEAWGTFTKVAGKYAFSAEAMMDATGNKFMVTLARQFHQKAGEAMGKESAYMDGLHQQTSLYLNKFENIILGLDADTRELVRRSMSTGTTPTDKTAAKVAADLRGFFNEMKDYIKNKDVRRLEMINGKPEWIPIDFRKDYWPQVWDTQVVNEKMEEFVQDLLKHHTKELEAIAEKANAEVAARKGAGPNTASDVQLKSATPQEITPEMVARQIVVRLLNSQGHVDLAETESEMGMTPVAAAVNRRTLDWLDKDVFDKYTSKDVTNIVTAYVRNIVKRGEYQSRFGPGGEKIRDMTDKAVLFEMGGDELITGAERNFDKAVEKWKARKVATLNAGKEFTEPYPTLRSVGQQLFKTSKGQEAHDKALKEAVGKLEQSFKAVQAMEGTLGADITPSARAINSWLMTYQSLRTLPLMLFTNFQDVIGLVANGGELGDAWTGFVTGLREIKNTWMKTKSADEIMQRAEFWGTVDAGSFQDTIGQTYGSVFMTGRAKQISDSFFRIVGADGWNRGIRGVAASVAERIITEWVRDGVNSKDKALVARVERLYGAGFDVKNIKLDAEGRLDIADAANQRAVQRWVFDAVPAPNAAHRPIWGSDPHFQVFMHLKNYAYSYHRVLLGGAVAQAKLGNYRPIMAMACGYVPIAIAAGAVKEMLVPGDEPPWMKGGLDGYLSYGWSRAGMLGVPQMYADNLFDLDPARAFGPTVDQLQNLLTTPMPEVRLNLSPFKGDTRIMSDHTLLGEGLGALPAGNIVKRIAA